MATGNLISLLGCVKENGYLLVTNPPLFFKDISSQKIVWVRSPVIIKDLNGNDVSCFQIAYTNSMGLTFETFYLQANANLPDLSAFNDGLVAVSATNKFTLYPDLIKSSDQAQSRVPADTDYLINDVYHDRQYLASKNQTVVTVSLKNRLSQTQFWFSGDDTYSGQYLYFTETGNA